MNDKTRSLLNTLRQSKILPGESIFEVLFFFVVDNFVKIRGVLFSQIHILNFLINKRYLKKDYFIDRVKFKDQILFDYIVYTFGDKGFSRGTSFSQVEALGKCLGEVFERVPFRKKTDKSLELSGSSFSLKQKKIAHIDLGKLSQATKSQKSEYGDLSYDEYSVFEWVQVTSFSTKKEVYVPQQMVYWYSLPRLSEKKIKEQNTSGLASGDTQESAMVSALYECLQRHVFFEAWYSPQKKLVTEVELESLFKRHKDIKELHAEAEANMLNLRVFRVGGAMSDVLDVYFCVLENKFTGGVYLGCSAGTNSYTVVYRAIQEAFSIYIFTNRILFNGEGKRSYEGVNTENFLSGIKGNDRVVWWGHHVDNSGRKVLEEFLGTQQRPYVYKKTDTSTVLHKALDVFGDFFFKISKDDLSMSVNSYSCRVILPNSYTLSLSEEFSTPVLRGSYPQNTKVHPFP